MPMQYIKCHIPQCVKLQTNCTFLTFSQKLIVARTIKRFMMHKLILDLNILMTMWCYLFITFYTLLFCKLCINRFKIELFYYLFSIHKNLKKANHCSAMFCYLFY